MFDLRINGKTAVIKPGNKIKLTRENQLTEDAGDWSLDVILPLNGCPENLAIFGNSIHRPESSLKEWIDAKLPFTLLAPPLNVSGHAIVTNVTNEEAKIQILGGISAFKHDMSENLGNTLITRLDLGEVLSQIGKNIMTNPYGLDIGDVRLMQILTKYYQDEEAKARGKGIDSGNDSPMPLLWTNDQEQYDATFVPVWSQGDQKRVNEKMLVRKVDFNPSLYRYSTAAHVFVSPVLAEKFVGSDLWRLGAEYYDKNRYAPMPYIYVILERVFNAIGYEVSFNELRHTWMKRLLMANCIQTVEIARMLPHWTVREFLDECRNFFGVEYAFSGNTVKIVTKSSHYSEAKQYCLEQADDRAEAELKSDDNVKGFVEYANVQYADLDEDAPELSIPKDVMDQALKQYVASAEDIPDEYDYTSRQTLYHTEQEDTEPADVEIYAFMKDNAGRPRKVAVDLCRPHIGHGKVVSSESREIDMEFRIRPCLMQQIPFSYYSYCPGGASWNDDGSTNGRGLENRPYDSADAKSIPLVKTKGGMTETSSWSVCGQLKGEANDTRPNLIEVIYIDEQYLDGNKFAGTKTRISMPGLEAYSTDYIDIYVGEGLGCILQEDGFYKNGSFGRSSRFNLSVKSESTADIANRLFYGGAKVDTRLVRRIDFYDDLDDYDPSAIYIIRGRRYICQKIEITITQDGLAKKKTGYFYEWNG